MRHKEEVYNKLNYGYSERRCHCIDHSRMIANYRQRVCVVALVTSVQHAAAFTTPHQRVSSSYINTQPSTNTNLYTASDDYLSSLGSSQTSSGSSANEEAVDPVVYNDFDDFDLLSSTTGSSAPPLDYNEQEGAQQQEILSASELSSSLEQATANNDDDSSIFEALQKRQEEIVESSRALLEQWTSGSAKTWGAFTINEGFFAAAQSIKNGNMEGIDDMDEEEIQFDWIRRIDIGTYPRVVCGSASGSIYVADVEAQCLLGVAKGVHSSNYNSQGDGTDHKLRYYLYGEFDGGGVLDVAMYGTNFVASAGREGGVKLFRYDNSDEYELQLMGEVTNLSRPLPGTTPAIITCLKFDSVGRLYMGGRDGLLRMVTFNHDDGNENDEMEMEVTVLSSAETQISPILSLDLCEELDMVAAAHANGNVCVYSISEHEEEEDASSSKVLGVWNPFYDTNNPTHARSVAFIAGHHSGGVSIIAGGGNGEMWIQEIDISSYNIGSNNNEQQSTTAMASSFFKENSMQQIKPNHQGPVISMATRPGGILVSCGHDGMLRVTQIEEQREPRPLYGLGGYKVWVGSICIDREGKRLLSDGRDDVCVVHDFGSDEEEGIEKRRSRGSY